MTRSRLPVVVVLLVALALAGVSRALVLRQRAGTEAARSDAQLSNLNSFALALLLGGLRGPLVMVLWSSSENQKNERNLEDFDTKVELIRLLQPEFDTVHLFQIWNKAYNVSAQLASMSNKYLAILDAIDYADSIRQQRPNNINLVYALGNVYGEKLGDAPTDKEYYRRRVRQDTLPHGSERTDRDNPFWRRLSLDQMVDSSGNILPAYLEPTRPRPADLPEEKQWNTGAELQYLEPYQPFRYGISPMALGYNYFKQAQVMLDTENQRHIQIADNLIARRPALALWAWSREEAAYARRIEAEALSQATGRNYTADDLSTARVPLTSEINTELAREAIFEYGLSAQVAADAIEEYQHFFRSGYASFQPFETQFDDMKLQNRLSLADQGYLQTMLAEGQDQRRQARDAVERYRNALWQVDYIVLKYNTPPHIAERVFPPGVTPDNLGSRNLTLDQIEALAERAVTAMIQYETSTGVRGDEIRQQYLYYGQRIVERLDQLQGFLDTPPAAATADAGVR